MKKIKGVFDIDIEIYTNVEKLCKKYNSESIENFENLDGRALHMIKNGRNRFIMYIGVKDFRTISHEASHITTFIMDHLTINDDEFRSYLVGHICEQAESIFTK